MIKFMIGLIGLGIWIYGVALAFQYSLIVGVLVFLFEPAPLIVGVLGIIGVWK